MTNKIGIGILVSGSGTNLQSIIDHIEAGTLDAEIKIVLSNRSDASAIERCKRHHLPYKILDHHRFSSRQKFDIEAVDILKTSGVELVILAGFMRLLSPDFLRAYPMRIMNIHPALLPAFPGTHVQQKAIDYGVKFSGCTVHFVDEGVDSGPIIIQAVVPVFADDSAEALAARILKEEHRIYPQAIQYFAERRIEINGRTVHIQDSCRMPETTLHNPVVTCF